MLAIFLLLRLLLCQLQLHYQNFPLALTAFSHLVASARPARLPRLPCLPCLPRPAPPVPPCPAPPHLSHPPHPAPPRPPASGWLLSGLSCCFGAQSSSASQRLFSILPVPTGILQGLTWSHFCLCSSSDKLIHLLRKSAVSLIPGPSNAPPDDFISLSHGPCPSPSRESAYFYPALLTRVPMLICL